LASEKLLDERSAFGREDARSHFRPVIEPRMPKQIFHRPGHARFVVPRPEHNSLHAGKNDTASAHGARLECHVQRAVVQPPAIEFRRRLSYRQQLGVSRWILVSHSSIARPGDYRSIANDNRPNRYLVSLPRLAGEIERVADVLFIRRQ